MKKILYLSIICATALFAAEAELGTIDVEAKMDTEVIKDVHGEDVQSADVAEALARQSSSVSLIRRSGISNDIIVRGQMKDNISVTIDGAKVCGACPNRMDPPISHVLSNNIDYIEINEGPFSVEEFGALSADIRIHTLKPEKEVHGDLNLNFGSWGYQKGSFNMSGGIGKVRFLLSGSAEKGGQYEDGDGNDFIGQIDREIALGKVPASAQYQTQYQDMDAFEKKTGMAKLFWEIADNQELRLSYTGNRSENVLYPSSKMDAIYDDSDIFNAEYIATDLGQYSKELKIQAYQTEVEHPMSTIYRKSVAMMGFEMTHSLDTKMQGAKIKNSFDLDNHAIITGLDYSLRNWDGGYFKNGTPLPEAKFHSIYDTDTENRALFLEDKISFGKHTVDIGLRYDDTTVTSQNIKQQDNDYSELNGFITGTYFVNEETQFFAGIGKSSRVPDAKELYWMGSMGNPIGTPELDATVNYELDLGAELKYENSTLKAKAFYGMLKDYIAYNASNIKKMLVKGNEVPVTWNAYENVDAKVYGIELSGTYIATDSIYFDYGLAYQRGEKENPLRGQTGTNMPDIPPLKFNASINYDYDDTLNMKAEVIAADGWSDFDAENGEQELDAYAILNLKATKTIASSFDITVGVDNVFDETYAVSNTYKDLVLLATPGNEAMLLNEPGRYFYTNLRYKF
ncbi:MAG: TonB-dependent receptor [Epsilonproteobacteria bacterium]|nr:MAG: TonB-dependent receptor [Campylobacterota bacterium]